MKRFRLTITQDIDVSFESDVAAREHAEYIVKECARLFFDEGGTRTLGKWTAKGGMVAVTAFEPLTDTGWPLDKNKKPEAEAPGATGE